MRFIGEEGSKFGGMAGGAEFKIDVQSITKEVLKTETELAKLIKKEEPLFGSDHLRKAKLQN